ncbi:hypothetical protein ACFW9F_22010 [Streptomyces sp. NPDC059506]|uniref:hypothetical protein n=1 Tax=Streptomyces sp. NPDC059506 TaxID=3347751 RepID=UPI00368CA7E6
MNRNELARALRQAGVADVLYEIPGVHEPRTRSDVHYFLRREPGSWVVGVSERAEEDFARRFPTEDEACRYLFGLLDPSTRPPRPPDAAERVAEVLGHSQEIQREAWEQFGRGRRERERPPGEG